MITVELTGFGIVQEPGAAPYGTFIVTVSQPQQRWSSYRSAAAFKALSDKLRKALPGLQACPQVQTTGEANLTVENLARCRAQLQSWLQHLLLYPAVIPLVRNFLMDGANTAPQHLKRQWGPEIMHPGFVGSGAGAEADEGDDMEMDDLFHSRHAEADVADDDADDDDVGLSHVSVDTGFHDDDDEDHDHEMDYMRKTAADAETVFYNSDMDDDAPAVGSVDMLVVPASHMSMSHQEADRYFAFDTSGGDGSSAAPSGSMAAPTLHQHQAGLVAPNGSGATPGAAPCKCKRRASLDSFKILKVIGKGSFGKVFLVRERESGKIYAMKVLHKENIIKRNQVEHTKTERNVLGYIRHPFIVGLNAAFQTKDKLYFVLDYCAGGELFFHLGKFGRFPEDRARFYAAEITLALEHVHKLDIIYRDLKPENVLLDARGHVRLTDFGLSKEGISHNSSGAHSFCGTPEYLAPEILSRQGHGRAVDWWSLGALLYEMLTGLPPFYCRDREKLFEKIRSGELVFPKHITEHARTILTGLLTRDPSKRLGSGETDAQEVKSHPFFVPINWDHLMKGDSSAPWEPTVCGSLDTSQFDKEFTSMPIFSPAEKNHASLPYGVSHDETFAGFTFTDESMLQQHMQHNGHHGAHVHHGKCV